MKNKSSMIIAWAVFVLIAISNIMAISNAVFGASPERNTTLSEIVFPLVPVIFAFVGALITSRQPGNLIGLVMMLPGLSLAFVIDGYLAPYLNGQLQPPASPTTLFMVILWFSGWNWLLLVFPIMFIMLLFPTGQPLSPRWKWLVYVGLGIAAFLIFLITFAENMAPNQDPVPWTIPNPIGFLKSEWADMLTAPFFILFPTWIVLSAVSLFMRFSRARAVEREQIKWLFYACVAFVSCYLPSFAGDAFYEPDSLLALLLPLGLVTFPIAIGIAILRYRLYDIDIIIRKTLQYALLTGLLALVYFGSILLLQSLTENLFGEQSPIVIVLSTLAIAAMFNPLRSRVQDFIDRRFYRKKYDAELALAQFAATARDEVDMDRLTGAMVQVVEETIQPERISLWLSKWSKP